MGEQTKTTKIIESVKKMGIKEDILQKIKEFKFDQQRRREFKRELDFKKYQALEIAKAKQEIKDVRAGKKKPNMFDEFELNPQDIKLYGDET